MIQQALRKEAADYVAYIKTLETQISKLRAKGRDTGRQEAKLAATRGAYLSNYSQGSMESRANRAAFQREINEMRSTTKVLMDRYFDETNAAYLRDLKRSLTDRATEEKLLRQRMSDRNERSRMGDAAYGFSKQRERRQLNGGANQFMSQAGIMSNYMAVGGVYGAGFYLGNFITQLDKEFRQFQAITATTNTEMSRMEERLLSVSEKTRFTALEVSEAATLMGQAGMSAGEVAEAIEPVTKLATAAGTDLKAAVDVVTSALNIFNLQASEAGHLSDVFTAALNESKLTLDQLALSLQYAGNIAATAGVSYNELTAAVGALANAGIRSGSTIGTGLRQLLVDLMAPSKNLKKEMASLGLTMADIDVETNGLTGVLMNLRAAGFDTTSAFEAFEVRAAAAYTALSNNVDVMAQLRQSFILSNAAAKANETQMQSLANTAANFGSNLGALTYTAFKPFLATLQDVVEGGSEVLSTLRQMGPVVEIVGTVFASLVSALLIARIGKLVFGLIGIGTAATGAAGGVRLLTAAMSANPVFLGLAALTTGITLLQRFGDTAGRTAAQLDALEAKQNEYQAQVDGTTNRIDSLNSAMDDLIKKQASLEAEGNGSLRKTKIMEIVASFQELAGSVDVSTSSVADLIEAMKDLRGEMVADLPAQIDLLTAQLDQRIAVLRGAATDHTKGEGSFIAGAAASSRFGNNGAVYSGDVPSFNDDVLAAFGPKVAEAFRALTGQTNLADLSGQEAQGLQAILEKLVIDLENKIKPLSDEAGLFGAGPELIALRQDLNFVKQLVTAFKPLASSLIDIQSLGLQRDMKAGERASAVLQGTTGYKAGQDAEDEASKYLTEGLANVVRTEDSIIGAKEAYDALQTGLQVQLDTIEASLKSAAEEMRAQGFTEEEIKAAIDSSSLKNDEAKLKNAMKKGSADANAAYTDFMAYLLEQQKKNLNKEIGRVQKELGKAKTEFDVNRIEDRLYALNDELAKIEMDLFETDPHKDVGKSDADLQIAKKQIADEQRDRRDELVTTVIEKRAALAEEVNKTYIEKLETELGNVETEMSNLVNTVDQNSTVEYIKSVAAKLEELDRKAKALAGEIAGVTVSDDYSAFTVGGLPSASANDIQKKIIAAANANGIPPHIALAIASFESGFNPSAKNPMSSAAGIYQNTNGNWDSHGLPRSGRNNIDMQIEAGMKDMRRTQEGLGSTQLSFKDYYGSHLLGQAGYKKALSNLNGNAVSVLGSDAVHKNGGNINQTVSQFLDTIVAKASVHLEKTKDLVQRPMDAAGSALDAETEKLTADSTATVKEFGEKERKASVKRQVKILDSAAQAIEGQINTLMTQSGKAENPEALQSIIDQVRTKWAEMMEKEIEAFTVKNKGTDGFEERLADLTTDLEAGLTGKVVTLLDRYQAAIENQSYAPLQDAQANLAAAQNPLYAKNFTDADVAGLEKNVQLQERAAAVERLNQLEQLHAYILQQVAAAESQYGANSQQVQALKERQYSVEQSLGNARRQNTSDTEAAARGEITLAQSIEAANRAWMMRNGLMDQNGDMISAAERAGQAWGTVLDTLTSGFSQLFMDLAMGTESAEEAFKKFGLSVIQMLMQMIAKQLAFNLVQSLMGGASSGAGSFLGMLFGAGAATGQFVAGIKRAANGEYVSGNNPFRDSELRSVMPGEMILRTSAVNQIGRDALEKVNALGNRKIASGMPTIPQPEAQDSRPINIWAVLPEEQQQIGPEDVVAYISDDIRRRGVTRTLIKAINTGKM
ncbi:phage tail tape measure protein [Mesorhizobium sp. WSM2240]